MDVRNEITIKKRRLLYVFFLLRHLLYVLVSKNGVWFIFFNTWDFRKFLIWSSRLTSSHAEECWVNKAHQAAVHSSSSCHCVPCPLGWSCSKHHVHRISLKAKNTINLVLGSLEKNTRTPMGSKVEKQINSELHNLFSVMLLVSQKSWF